MNNKNLNQGISRRDAIKMMGLGSATFVASGTNANASTSMLTNSDVQGKVLIIGGGLAGMSTAAKLGNSSSNLDITIIEPEANSCSYQPGQTLVGAGIWEKSNIIYKRDDFIPQGVKIIKEKAVSFNPSNNTVETDNGTIVKYDYMIIAAGLKLNYAAIKGLEAAGEAYSSGDNKKLVEELNKAGVSSVYTADTAEATWINMQKFIADAKSGKKVNGLFTHPNTPIKGVCASKDMMYLANSRLEEIKANKNAKLHLYTNDNLMFDVKEYHEAVVKQFEERDFKWSYGHNLIAIDAKNKIATFTHHWEEKATRDEEVKVSYDFIHITPPMKAPDEIGNSKIGSPKGWVPVNKETLQHVKYNNIFALGDIINAPMGKTSASIGKQSKIVVNNIISMIKQGKIPQSNKKYDGYTACPLITSIGTVMFAEYNWTKKPKPTIATFDSTKERYIWWLLKIYLQKPITIYGMLSGKIS